jgi:hypothetical protein
MIAMTIVRLELLETQIVGRNSHSDFYSLHYQLIDGVDYLHADGERLGAGDNWRGYAADGLRHGYPRTLVAILGSGVRAFARAEYSRYAYA